MHSGPRLGQELNVYASAGMPSPARAAFTEEELLQRLRVGYECVGSQAAPRITSRRCTEREAALDNLTP